MLAATPVSFPRAQMLDATQLLFRLPVYRRSMLRNCFSQRKSYHSARAWVNAGAILGRTRNVAVTKSRRSKRGLECFSRWSKYMRKKWLDHEDAKNLWIGNIVLQHHFFAPRASRAIASPMGLPSSSQKMILNFRACLVVVLKVTLLFYPGSVWESDSTHQTRTWSVVVRGVVSYYHYTMYTYVMCSPRSQVLKTLGSRTYENLSGSSSFRFGENHQTW